MNVNDLKGKMKIVYQNYPFNTHKFRKLYYSSPYHKNLIDYLYGVIPMPQLYHQYKEVVPHLEAIPAPTFTMLCELEQMGKLDSLVNLIKLSSR